MHKAVFLDRDGVINEDRDDYVKNIHELVIYPYVPESISALNEVGFDVIVISNQQGIAKGLIKEEDLDKIQMAITRQVESAGGKISAFYYCKHFSSDRCSCRKPQPGMILQAASDFDIDLSQSFMVGDTTKDVGAGKSAGCRTVLLATGNDSNEPLPDRPDFIADDLRDAVKYIVECSNQN